METFEHLLYQLHLSYLQARKNKRNTHNQLKFEIVQETQLYDLAQAIYKRTYAPKPCIAFIINKPVMREIFAADFVDRVIHHLIYRCIYSFIDNKLINNAYSCRLGKGTLYGIERAKGFMRSCSEDYTKETYYLKLDIEAYHGILKKEVFNRVDYRTFGEIEIILKRYVHFYNNTRLHGLLGHITPMEKWNQDKHLILMKNLVA